MNNKDKNLCKLVADRQIKKQDININKFRKLGSFLLNQNYYTKNCELHNKLVFYKTNYVGCPECIKNIK